MTTFRQLSVWDDKNTSEHLKWYVDVAENRRPAKFLIADKIPVEIALSSPTEQLWKQHELLTDKFIETWKTLKEEPNYYDELSEPQISLLDLNVELVNRMLKSCTFCQWECDVDRTLVDTDSSAKSGTCQLGEESRVGSFFHHRGEELIYRGTSGSGTIFFTSCNMRCAFCQNGNISKDKNNGVITTEKELASMAWLLRMEGCHNINFVGGNPTIHLHTIIRAIKKLRSHTPSYKELNEITGVKSDSFIRYPQNKENGYYQGEFNAPMLWNDNFFMSEETMKILRTVIDVWLPDFKFGPTKKCATTLSRTPWYWETITRNHQMIYNWNEAFTIRHLIMPNHVDCCTKPILDWIKENIPKAPVNIMDQYHPDSYTNPISDKYNPRYEEISRRINKSELNKSIKYAQQLGINYKTVTYQ